MAIVRATKFQTGVHVNEEDLLASDLRCPLCFDADERRSVLLLQAQPDVHLLHCCKCGGYSASRLPTVETLSRYYGGYYRLSDHTVTCDNPRAFAKHVLNYAGPFLNERSIAILKSVRKATPEDAVRPFTLKLRRRAAEEGKHKRGGGGAGGLLKLRRCRASTR